MNKRAVIGLWFCGFLVTVFGVCASFPLVHQGLPALSPEAARHAAWLEQFITQLRGGIWIPRWLPEMNLGRGSPVFFLESPLGYYLSAIIEYLYDGLIRRSHPGALSLSAGASLFFSCIAMFLWLERLAPARTALYAAVMYTIMPCHLAGTTLYDSDPNGMWAYVWMPMLLRSIDSIARRRRRGLVGASVFFGLLALSSPTLAVVFIPVLLGYSMLAPQLSDFEAGYLRSLVRMLIFLLASTLFGLGLAAVYLVPAAEMSRHTALATAGTTWFEKDLLFGALTADSERRQINDAAILSTLGFASCFFFIFSRRLKGAARRFTTYWMLVVCACGLLLTEAGLYAWQSLSFFAILQRPLALGALLSLATAALCPAAIRSIEEDSLSSARIVLGILAGVFAVSWVAGLVWLYQQGGVRDTHFENTALQGYTQYRPLFALTAGDTPESDDKVRLEHGGIAAATSWKPRTLSFRAEAALDTVALVRQFHLPFWVAQIEADSLRLRVMPSTEDGLLEVLIPAGTHDVRVDLVKTPGEAAGQAITIVSICVILLLLGIALFFGDSETSEIEEDVEEDEEPEDESQQSW